jgi:hypothetical protein
MEHVEFHSKKKIWEISASSWFYYKKFNTMHGHMNVKYWHVYLYIQSDSWIMDVIVADNILGVYE